MGEPEATSSAITAQSDFPRLVRHVKRDRGRFSIVFVVWDRADTEHVIYDTLLSKLANVRFEQLLLTSGDPIEVFHRIEEAGSHGKDTVVVEGLHLAFPERVVASPDDRPPILQALNLYRERLRIHPVCLVLILPEHALDLIARGAPDFWSWRSGVFCLQPRPNETPATSITTPYATSNSAETDVALYSRDEVEAETIRLTTFWSERFGDQVPIRELPTAARIAKQLAALYQRSSRFALSEDWRGRAIDLYQKMASNEPDPSSRAAALVQLGVLLNESPTGDRAASQNKAIAAYEAALEVYTPQDFPAEWATTQNNLGNSWFDLPTGDRAANLTKAIAAYEAALQVRTRQNFPIDWAMTQNNLGTAWQNLPTGDRAANLTKAISAYEAVLEVFTRQDFPAKWAIGQNNLGTAWAELPIGDRAVNLVKAIAAFESALQVRTRQDFPVDWATTQNNLGNAWGDLPTGDRAANLAAAITALEAALKVYTRRDFPVDWAMTQNNIAVALADLADQPRQDRCGLLLRAIASGKGALVVRTPDAFPHDHANTAKNLAIDRKAYEAAGCDKAIAFDDIPPAT